MLRIHGAHNRCAIRRITVIRQLPLDTPREYTARRLTVRGTGRLKIQRALPDYSVWWLGSGELFTMRDTVQFRGLIITASSIRVSTGYSFIFLQQKWMQIVGRICESIVKLKERFLRNGRFVRRGSRPPVSIKSFNFKVTDFFLDISRVSYEKLGSRKCCFVN